MVGFGVEKGCQRRRFCVRKGVQLHVHIDTTADGYIKEAGHRKVKPPESCLDCGHQKLHRHGFYERGVVELGVLVSISVARFLCSACQRTVSCLPSFALPYRLIVAETVEAFFEERYGEAGIDRYWDLLVVYRERWEERAPEIERISGGYFGPLNDQGSSKRLLKAMLGKWNRLRRASQELLHRFGESLLGFYPIHDWARKPRGSVDPLRKAARLDSG